MVNMSEIVNLLYPYCLNSFMGFLFYIIISTFCLFIWMGSVDSLIYHLLQALWFSSFKFNLFMSNNQLMGTVPTEMVNMNELGRLLYTYCLYSFICFLF